MLIVCEALAPEQASELAPLLSAADESPERISAALAARENTAYAARLGAPGRRGRAGGRIGIRVKS